MKLDRLIRAVVRTLCGLSLAVLVSCGGSTSGTGGVTIQGQLLSADGQPLPGVSVTSLQSGETTTTDSQGNFSLQSERSTVQEIEFDGQGVRATGRIENADDSASRIEVTFEASDDGRNVRPKRVESSREDDQGSSGSGGGGNDDGSSSNGGGDDRNDDDRGDSSGSGGNDDPSPTPSTSPSPAPTQDGGDDSSGSGGGNPPEQEGSGGGDSQGDREDDQRGAISALTASSLTVNGVEFLVDGSTEIRGSDGRSATLADFQVGDRVRVRGRSRSGTMYAERIEFER